MEAKRSVYKVLVGKPEEKTLLGRHKHRWEYNVKIHLKDVIGECGVDSSGSGQRVVMGSCERDNETLSFMKCWEY
jgi:hypothetical protein